MLLLEPVNPPFVISPVNKNDNSTFQWREEDGELYSISIGEYTIFLREE